MKLYYSPGACSLSPHIVAREAGLSIDLERVDNKAKKTASGDDYWQINPKGQVPVLELDDGDRLTEGPAIVQYLADQSPNSKLAPAAGTKERYHVQEWLNFITSEIHKSFSPLFKPNTPDAYKPIAKENLNNRFAYIDKHLAGKQYLMGNNFTVVDAYLFTVLRWSTLHQIDLSRYPNIAAFMGRVNARPKVQEALQAEGLVKAAAA
jgi:glutathione S-transferase